jgi:dTDP-4-dehydrorhamnose 3,5-epimerase-like enzyme
MSEIKIFKGDIAVDDRGRLSFINDFNFEGVKRFYQVRNHRKGFVRAWHGHKIEAKYVTVVQGSAIVGAVKVDNWDSPSKELKPERWVMSGDKPQVIYLPAGYANGFMSLTDDLIILFFSTTTLQESMGDDYRFDARYWDIWDVVER